MTAERATTFPKRRSFAEWLIGGGGKEEERRRPFNQKPVFVGFFGGGGIALATSAPALLARGAGGRELAASGSTGMSIGPPGALHSSDRLTLRASLTHGRLRDCELCRTNAARDTFDTKVLLTPSVEDRHRPFEGLLHFLVP
jgi:hypothetical protein